MKKMMDGKPLSENKKKLLNIIAERALRRGRKLTVDERIDNLEEGLGYAKGSLRERLILAAKTANDNGSP